MKTITILFLLSFACFATELDSRLFAIKASFEQQAYELKLAQEQEMMLATGKVFDLKSGPDLSCVEWVYQGPASRDEAARACAGVRSLECLSWVHQGPASRVESAQSCRGVELKECLDFVFQGPSSRAESAEACRGVIDMACVHLVFQGSASRVEAARSCRDRRHNPQGC